MERISLSKSDTVPRVKDYLRPEDLDTEGCLRLVRQIMKDAAAEYMQARRTLNAEPHNKGAQMRMRACREFYTSDWFKALACGLVQGETVMELLDKRVKGGYT